MSKVALTGNASGTGTITLASPNTNTSTTYTLPSADGTSGQVLKTDASGGLSFGDVGVANITGTLPVANGGTGSTTLTANNVLLGNGTSALQVVAPGTSGNVLTSDGTTWTSAAAAGGAWEYLSTTTASGASSATVSGIGSDYDMYAIIGTNIRTSLTTGLLARMIIGGTERTSSYYLYSLSAGATNSNNTSSDISLTVTDIDNSSTNACSFIMYIPMPYLTTTYKSIIWDFYYPGNGFQVNGTVAYNQSGVTSALTGIVLDPSGSATLNGTFRLYGIKNS